MQSDDTEQHGKKSKKEKELAEADDEVFERQAVDKAEKAGTTRHTHIRGTPPQAMDTESAER